MKCRKNTKSKNPNVVRTKIMDIYDRYQTVLATIVYKFFYKKTSGSDIKNGNISNKELAKDLHELNI